MLSIPRKVSPPLFISRIGRCVAMELSGHHCLSHCRTSKIRSNLLLLFNNKGQVKLQNNLLTLIFDVYNAMVRNTKTMKSIGYK